MISHLDYVVLAPKISWFHTSIMFVLPRLCLFYPRLCWNSIDYVETRLIMLKLDWLCWKSIDYVETRLCSNSIDYVQTWLIMYKKIRDQKKFGNQFFWWKIFPRPDCCILHFWRPNYCIEHFPFEDKSDFSFPLYIYLRKSKIGLIRKRKMFDAIIWSPKM